ncbi:hypothetical protein ABIB40_003025 [Pedobacter sp. UYP30]
MLKPKQMMIKLMIPLILFPFTTKAQFKVDIAKGLYPIRGV